jgi:hypothetical protein
MMKILIAEDDRELRQLFTHVLTKHGYTVTGVSNGQQALDAMDDIGFGSFRHYGHRRWHHRPEMPHDQRLWQGL